MPADWKALGCMNESYGQRLLAGTAFSSTSMTPMLCMTQCQKSGFKYAGTEYTDEVSHSYHLLGLWLMESVTVVMISPDQGASPSLPLLVVSRVKVMRRSYVVLLGS